MEGWRVGTHEKFKGAWGESRANSGRVEKQERLSQEPPKGIEKETR